MKLYIPDLGERIRLTSDWTFDLYCEKRNYKLLREIGQPESWLGVDEAPGPWKYTLVSGTVLDVDRIYIRKGNDDYSSVSFVIVDDVAKSKGPFGNGGKRFWAKLEDVNEIEYELRAEDQPWWFGIRDRLISGESVVVVPRITALGKDTQFTIYPITNLSMNLAKAKYLVVKDGQKVFFADKIFGNKQFIMIGNEFVRLTPIGNAKCSHGNVRKSKIVGYVE